MKEPVLPMTAAPGGLFRQDPGHLEGQGTEPGKEL